MEADRRSVQTLCERALDGEDLSRDEMVVLLGLKDLENLEVLRQAAEEGLRRWVGDAVDVLFRLPISSYCDHNCLYCDLRRSNEDLARFRLGVDEIVGSVRRVRELSFGTVVLDGAQDPDLDVDWVCRLLSALDVEDAAGPSIVLSLGERDASYYERLRSCGASRYILNHKTASPILYNELHPERDYFDRLQCMRSLLGLQYRVGTSVSVGLPHQDLWDLTDDLMQARELGLDTVIVGPFVPGARSPLSGSPRGSIQRSLTAIAVARLALRDVVIPGGLSFGLLDAGSSVEALRWGASAVICGLDEGRCPEADAATSVTPMADAMTTRIRSLGRRLGEHRPAP